MIVIWLNVFSLSVKVRRHYTEKDLTTLFREKKGVFALPKRSNGIGGAKRNEDRVKRKD